MPVPSLITDLSATAASNSPSGSEAPTEGDNHLRTAYAFIKQLYDGVSGVAYPTLTQLASTASAAEGDALIATKLITTSAKDRTQHDRNEEDPRLTDWDDTDETGATSSSVGLAAALASGRRRIYVPPGTFSLGSVVAATLTGELELYGPGRFVYTGSNNTDNMVTVHCNGYGFSCIGPTFDGDEKSCGGLRISNNTDTFVEVNLKGCTFIDLRMNADAIWNNACYMAGAFRRVVIDGNTVRNVTRAAGTGTPGSNGTSGIDVQHEVATRYCKQCIHTNNVYENISGDDAAGSADNVDFDAFKYFVPNPTNFPNSDSTIYSYGQGSLVSHGNVYRNCRGRSIKVQALANIHDEKIIRDADYTQTGGASEINLQYGAGTVRDIEFYYSDYLVGSTVTSPLQSGQALVGFFQGTWYDEQSSSISVSGLKVINAIKSGVGEIIPYIVQCTAGTTPSTKDRTLIHISDVSVNRGDVGFIFQHSADTGSNTLVRLDGISVAKLLYGAVGANDFTGPSMRIVATGVMNIDGVTTPANAKMFIADTSPAGGNLGFAGTLEGHGNYGFLNTYNRGADFTAAPMLLGAALSGPSGFGGAASVQNVLLADDASHTFDRRFYTSSRGLIIVSVNYDYVTQGIFACGSNQIHQIAAPTGELFTPSTTGSLVDTDGTLCLWFTGGALNIKNRLGASYVTTVMFIG